MTSKTDVGHRWTPSERACLRALVTCTPSDRFGPADSHLPNKRSRILCDEETMDASGEVQHQQGRRVLRDVSSVDEGVNMRDSEGIST